MRNKLVLKGPLDNTVALVRYRPDANSLAKALDLCQGLQGVSTRTQILIKPNLVFWDDSLPSLWCINHNKNGGSAHRLSGRKRLQKNHHR
jgi:hypothetical protein